MVEGGDGLKRASALQSLQAPTDPGGPKRRTWEGYADDYRDLSERLVEMSERQQALLDTQASLEQTIADKERVIARLKARRAKDIERLGEIARNRDLLERRASAQMAKVATAMAKVSEREQQIGALERRAVVAGSTTISLPPPMAISGSAEEVAPDMVRPSIAAHAPARPAGGWLARIAQRRWWRSTVRYANMAYRAGELVQSEMLFRAALMVRETANLWSQLGDVLREQNQFDAAEQAYDRCLQFAPDRAEVIFLAGYCDEMAGRRNEARSRYERALALDPGLASRYDHLRGFHDRLRG